MSSSHFKDGKFVNLNGNDEKSFWDFLKMRASTEWPSWPEMVESKTYSEIQKMVGSEAVHVTHINHSTVLIQTAGLNILTDPIYSQRCSPVQFAGPKRVREPGLEFENLPKIDVIVISHDHYDHLDLDTVKKIYDRDRSKIYAGLGVGRHLENLKIPVQEMDWWQTNKFQENLEISFVPVQHFSGRGLFDRNSTLWGGFVLKFSHVQIYFAGDTGYADHFVQTFKRFGPMDISIIPIGAYAPRGFMKFVHMDPIEAVQAHLDLKSKKSFGVHYGTFQLTSEPIEEPIQLLKKELQAKKINPDDFVTPDFGKTIKLSVEQKRVDQ